MFFEQDPEIVKFWSKMPNLKKLSETSTDNAVVYTQVVK